MEEPQARGTGIPLVARSPAGRLSRLAAFFVLAGLASASCGGDGSLFAGPSSRAQSAAPAPSMIEAAPEGRLLVTNAVADEFLASVLRSQDGAPRHVVRWPAGATVRVKTRGSVTSEDSAVLDESIRSLGTGLALQVQRSSGDAEVTVHFAPPYEWPDIVGHDRVDTSVAGWTYTTARGSDARLGVAGELKEVLIVVDSELPQAARNRVIAHELGHAFGLGHARCQATLMADGDASRPLWSPTPLDAELLSLLYDPRVEAGMIENEVEAVLDRSGTVGALCGAVQWRLVDVAGEAYYCGAGGGTQPCVRAAYEEPTWPVAEPDGWLTGGGFSAVEQSSRAVDAFDG